MDSQMDSTIRGGASSMSKPTEARSSALANKGEGGADKKKGVRDGLSTVIECKSSDFSLSLFWNNLIMTYSV